MGGKQARLSRLVFQLFLYHALLSVLLFPLLAVWRNLYEERAWLQLFYFMPPALFHLLVLTILLLLLRVNFRWSQRYFSFWCTPPQLLVCGLLLFLALAGPGLLAGWLLQQGFSFSWLALWTAPGLLLCTSLRDLLQGAAPLPAGAGDLLLCALLSAGLLLLPLLSAALLPRRNGR